MPGFWNRSQNAIPTYLSDDDGLPLGSATNPIRNVATQQGSGNIATGQMAVTTAATLVVAARAGRNKVTITSTAATVFYVGAAGVSATTGLYVAGNAGASVTLDTSAAVYAIGSANVTVSYVEFF